MLVVDAEMARKQGGQINPKLCIYACLQFLAGGSYSNIQFFTGKMMFRMRVFHFCCLCTQSCCPLHHYKQVCQHMILTQMSHTENNNGNKHLHSSSPFMFLNVYLSLLLFRIALSPIVVFIRTGMSTSLLNRLIWKTIKAINFCCHSDLSITFPQSVEEVKKAAAGFNSISKEGCIWNCVAVVDGYHRNQSLQQQLK